MTTRLSITATPGPEHSFSPKTAAGGKGSTRITALTVWAAPGGLRTFDPKTPAGVVVTQITELSVMATPGRRHVFVAKDPFVPTPEPEDDSRPSGGWAPGARANDELLRKQILREDEEILAVIMAYWANKHRKH